jgi:hypothetical protein
MGISRLRIEYCLERPAAGATLKLGQKIISPEFKNPFHNPNPFHNQKKEKV